MTLSKKELFQLVGTSRHDDDSDGLPNKTGIWKKGLSEAEQLFVMRDNHSVDGFDSDTEINPKQVKLFQKRARLATQRLKNLRATPSGRNIKKVKRCSKLDCIAASNAVNYKVKRAFVEDNQCQHAEYVAIVMDSKGETHVLRVLLDTGCSKSIILKKFTDSKRWTKQSKGEQVRYITWGGSFDTHCKASVGFQLLKFNKSEKQSRIPMFLCTKGTILSQT